MDDKSMMRWIHWWNGSALDRPVMQIYAYRERACTDVGVFLRKAEDPIVRWADIENIFALRMGHLDNTLLLAEAVQVFNPGWSVGNACFFGCEPNFRPDSVWVAPLEPGEDEFPAVVFDENCKWLKFMLDFTRYCVGHYNGKFYLTPHFGNSAADTLFLMRPDLLADVIEDPEWVKKSLDYVAKAIYRVCDMAAEIIGCSCGYASWFGCAADKQVVIADADISCMLSTEIFERVFIDQIVEQIRRAPYSQYHLDGPMAIKHLDTLLRIPELNAVQWVPGAGKNAVLQWAPLIKKIQKSRKAVLVYATPDEIPPLLDEVRNPEGLCISVWCANEKQAHELFEYVDRRYRPK